jgi:hypothetical protein
MTRDHFAKANRNSRYQSSFYKNSESREAKAEQNIENFLSKMINKTKRIFGRK